jgi:hypothetical protein
MKRRRFIKVMGGGVLFAATGISGFAMTRTPHRALSPWKSDDFSNTDPRLRAASYAILAPNPHNRQPWMIKLGKQRDLMLYCDLDRRLPHTDPFDRQILIGFGCFLELLVLTGAETGQRVDIELFPEGLPAERLDKRPIAHAVFAPDASVARDPLFKQVLTRRSNKEPFDISRSLGESVLTAIAGAGIHDTAGAATNDAGRVKALRNLAWEAHLVEINTPRTLKESVDLMRIGKNEIEANPDGIDLGGSFFEFLKLTGLISRKEMLERGSSAFEQGKEHYRGLHFSAMAFSWIVTPGNSRYDQVAAGRDYVRQNLMAASLGVGIHPISQALQEYNEMRDIYTQLYDMLAVPPQNRVQMFSRLGYGPATPPSPRWELKTRLMV